MGETQSTYMTANIHMQVFEDQEGNVYAIAAKGGSNLDLVKSVLEQRTKQRLRGIGHELVDSTSIGIHIKGGRRNPAVRKLSQIGSAAFGSEGEEIYGYGPELDPAIEEIVGEKAIIIHDASPKLGKKLSKRGIHNFLYDGKGNYFIQPEQIIRAFFEQHFKDFKLEGF